MWACEPFKLPSDISGNNAAPQFFQEPASQQAIDIEYLDYRLLTQAIFYLTNQARLDRKKSTVSYHPQLAHAACLHARDMVKNDDLGHINRKDSTSRTPRDRLRAMGIDPHFVSENIAEMSIIQYAPGKAFYTRTENSQTVVSHTADGPPIEAHTYLSFAEALLDRWMSSRGHRRNILSKEVTYTGAACHYAGTRQDIDVLYCVQLFAS